MFARRVRFVLVLLHSQIFFGIRAFRAFLAICATPFDHALAKFEFRFGFQDEGVNKPCRDHTGGQGPPGD